MISGYDWAGGHEAMIRLGPAQGPVVIAAMPLFEEANRTRALMMAILRALAAQGIAGALPDLPGTGESLVSLEAVTLAEWRAAFTAAAESIAAEGRPVHALSIRGGALVEADAAVLSRWQLSPTSGDGLLREMLRARAITDPGQPLELDAANTDGPAIELFGNLVSRSLLAELASAEPLARARIRVVRLRGERGLFDRSFDAKALWRRAEPDNDRELAGQFAQDVAEWIGTCGE